ncbi:tyrosine-type recombinase/integrase [Bacillus sp. N447-1]|uniref:tyrosine-type recombinase/integrase n=1 Tax=Bacillus TaxID=1386 RepID=UPI001F61D619|nr:MULTISPECIES: tyrosine-type recombinase/integrase [Bacillus]HDR4425386.1 tyrosine-type recombinase/integrase [Bacillus cereus]MDA2145825.1 tyrosine-type recombinase/integrase [Bacillus cereus group sp. Bc248]MDA2173675.1 tyrosine-type recombinase/integrase [Bacillus cereus group sp. Bc247]MDA2664044.1 tyrosine-type recombinase/integrase [Bacillus cereus group sp. Bc032]MDA2674762.1 tyrosine-type recombinase/integrase [Bacillus cereus group sp. Bc031]
MLHKYRKYLIDKGKSQNTLLSYINDLQIFFQEMRLNPDSYVISNDIKKWIRAMLNPREGKALSVSTINRRLNTLRSYFSWAEREQYIKVNPMIDIKDLKVADEEYEKIMWLTEKEFEALLERMRKYPVKTRGVNPEEKYRRDRAIIYILTYAGLRVEELSSLKITDIDLDLKKLRVIGKGTKVRTIPMSNFLYNEVFDWLQFRNKIAKDKEIVNQSPYVFYSQRSEKFSIRGIQAMIENYSTSDKKLTPHMFRHTFCKWMLKATNNDIEKVRRLAGHSHISTTTRYLKNSFDELTDAVEAMPIF